MTQLHAACLAAVVFFVSPGNAQTFPNKTIRIIVPFTPGGSNDVVAREIATGLQDNLKQTAVVENKPGGGGVIAYSFVAKLPPDGHVMLIAPASFTAISNRGTFSFAGSACNTILSRFWTSAW